MKFRCMAMLLLVGCINPDNLVAGVIGVTADTFISSHSGLGGSSQSHGLDEELFLIGPVAAFQSSPLLYFDLAPLSGLVLTSDVELLLTVVATHSGGVETQSSVSLYRTLVDWDEDTVNLNNFGPSPGLNSGIDYVATPFSTLAPLSAGPGDVVTFLLPQALVQSWIDDPTQNYGLLIGSSETGFNQDIRFGSRESGSGAVLSSTQFDNLSAVPEPSSLALLTVACLAMATGHHRRSTKRRGLVPSAAH